MVGQELFYIRPSRSNIGHFADQPPVERDVKWCKNRAVLFRTDLGRCLWCFGPGTGKPKLVAALVIRVDAKTVHKVACKGHFAPSHRTDTKLSAP